MLDFFILPFSTSFHFGNLLQLTFFLLLPALAAIFPLKTGALNLGGEGQIYAGGFFSTLVLLYFSEIQSSTSIVFVLIIATIVAIISGGLLAFISGWALEKANISEVVSSFLISCAFIPIGDYLLGSVFLDKTQNLVTTKKISSIFRATNLISSSNLNSTIFVIIVIVILAWCFFKFTKPGMIFSLSGKGDEFAKAAGFSPKRNRTISLTISGALNGLTGLFAVIGVYYSVHIGFYSGMSWNGLTIALLCSTNLNFLLPASFVFSYLQKCVDNATLQGFIGINTGTFFKGFLLLLISLKLFFKKIHRGKKC